MEFDLFKKIIDEMSEYSWCSLNFSGLGEPAMHPKIAEMVNYLADKPLKTRFATNGTLLTRFPPERILGWKIDILGVSIDGYDTASYGFRRPGGDYVFLRKRLIDLFAMKSRMGIKRPEIQVWNVIFPGTTPDQIQRFKDDWLPFSDSIRFNTFMSGNESVTEEFEHCQDIDFLLNVRWDGRVPLCGYQIWYGNIEWLGDLHYLSIGDVWGHERLQEVRRAHRNGDLTRIEFCRRCFHTQGKKRILENSISYDRDRNSYVILWRRLTRSGGS